MPLGNSNIQNRKVSVPWFCQNSPWTTCPPTLGWLQRLYPSCWTGQRVSWEEPQVQLKSTAIWPAVGIVLEPPSSVTKSWAFLKSPKSSDQQSIQQCHISNMFKLNKQETTGLQDLLKTKQTIWPLSILDGLELGLNKFSSLRTQEICHWEVSPCIHAKLDEWLDYIPWIIHTHPY